MAIRDKAAAFLGKLGAQVTPAAQTVGAGLAQQSAGILQQGANVLADAGDAAFRRGGVTGNVQMPLSGASTCFIRRCNDCRLESDSIRSIGEDFNQNYK